MTPGSRAVAAAIPPHGRIQVHLSAFASAFRTPDLRKKLLFVLGMIALYRLGFRHPDAGRRLHGSPALHQRGAEQQPVLADQPVQRWGAAAAVHLRARHHALHHGVDHPAAPGGRDPASGDPPQGGSGRAGHDHPVHALSDHRAGRAAVGLDPGAGAQPRQVVPGLQGKHRARRLGLPDGSSWCSP